MPFPQVILNGSESFTDTWSSQIALEVMRKVDGRRKVKISIYL